MYEPPEPGVIEVNSYDGLPDFAGEGEEARFWDSHAPGPGLLAEARRGRDYLANGERSFWVGPETSLEPASTQIDKPWGHEVIWAQSETYTGKLINVKAGHRLSLQYHTEKVETQCLLSGKAILVLDGPDGMMHEVEMEPGKGYTIRPRQRHRLVAVEDSVIVEVSTPERGKTVRLQDDYARPDETEELRAKPGRGWSEPGEAT